MTILLFTLLSSCIIRLALSLSITNITSTVTLTNIFPGGEVYPVLTYYSNPNVNSTNTSRFLWYLAKIENDLKSDIFTPEFTQYNGINQLPFTITEQAGSSGLAVCTSPISMDIINCWTIYNDNFMEVDCKIYFAENNKFSDIIRVVKYGFVGVLCFDDSYFFTYMTSQESGLSFYGTILDLKGNIIHTDIPLKQVKVNVWGSTLLVKGGNHFNAQMIDKSASDVFKICLGSYVGNPPNATNIYDIYGYYTAINDTKVPIYIYNYSITEIKQNIYSTIYMMEADILDWTNTCCYVEFAEKFIGEFNDAGLDTYARITDIFGNKIKIQGTNPDSEYISLTRNLSESIDIVFVDLSVISQTNIHYFMVVGGNNGVEVMICDVFYLESDVSDDEYKLGNVGHFDTATVVYQSAEPPIFSVWFDVFNVPQTNYLFFVWGYYNVTNYKYSSYGQTWMIH